MLIAICFSFIKFGVCSAPDTVFAISPPFFFFHTLRYIRHTRPFGSFDEQREGESARESERERQTRSNDEMQAESTAAEP